MGLNKLNTIAELLGKDKEVIVRWVAYSGNWFVHCYMDDGSRSIHQNYTTDLEKELDVIIEKLGGKK